MNKTVTGVFFLEWNNFEVKKVLAYLTKGNTMKRLLGVSPKLVAVAVSFLLAGKSDTENQRRSRVSFLGLGSKCVVSGIPGTKYKQNV